MQEIWFYETKMLPNGRLVREKFLMVMDENHDAKAKYNLTQMGLEHINSVKELKQIIGSDYYDFNE